MLKDTGDGGADGDDSLRLLDCICCGLGELESLGVHVVISDAVGTHGLECADADMQGDKGMRE